MPERRFDGGTGYRYGFNGKENDKEISEGGQDYGMRIYDTRLGRFLSVDPIAVKYPALTPYQFASNNPIAGIDMDGLEFRYFMISPKMIMPATMMIQHKQLENAVKVQRADPNAGLLKIAFKASWMTMKGGVHTGLDVLGLIPVVGEITDAINGGLYLLEKDYENAAYSFAATVPIVGWASTGAKWTKKALKFSDNAFHSVSGLIFKQGSKHGNRLAHVLEHSVDNLAKSKHGVFDVGTDGIISTLEDAYSKIKSVKWNDKLAVGSSETVNGITRSIRKEESGIISENFVVDMGKKVGYEGGSKGSKEALNKIQISVEKGTSDVITAYPVK